MSLRDVGPLLALVLLLVVFTAVNPKFLGWNNVRSILDQSSVLLVLAVGATFVILLGSIDLSVEGVMAASALTLTLLAHNNRNGNDLGYLAVLLAILVGVAFGLFSGIAHAKLRIPSFMVTLGVGAIGIGVATVLFGGDAPRLLDSSLRGWGLGRWGGVSRLTFVAVVVLGLAWVISRYTRIGRYIYVVGGAEDVARLSGVNVTKFKIAAFALAGACSGIGGVMAVTQLGAGDVAIGSGQLFATITAVVVGGTLLSGGRGGVLHTVVGVLLIAVLDNGLVLAGVSSYIQQAVQGVVIVVAITAATWRQRARLRVIK